MKTLLRTAIPLFVVGLLMTGFALRASYSVDKAHSSVGFEVRHLAITKVDGKFNDYDASISMEPGDLSTLEASATVRIESIDTGIERRDNHLRSPDFFDAETYPEMTFVSKEVRNIDGNEFELVGDLTIKDVTKEVVLEAEMIGPVMGTQGEERVGFEAETTINRFDYGLQWNKLTEAGGLVVSEDVDIVLNISSARE